MVLEYHVNNNNNIIIIVYIYENNTMEPTMVIALITMVKNNFMVVPGAMVLVSR